MTRQLWIADKLRAYGLTVIEVPGWQDRGRPGPFDPAGVMCHHTAAPDRTKDAPSLNVCVEGRTGLPGPLCQILVARSGKVYVISAGRCNHAGEGTWAGITDGNKAFIGLEAENDGVGETWPDAQVEAMVRATAALCAGLTGHVGACPIIAHREWAPKRKIDPRGIDMDAFRRRVTAAMRPTGDTVPPTRTDYARQIQEALIANGATTLVPDDKLGPATVAATKAVLSYLNSQVKAAKTQIEGLTKELADAYTDVESYAREGERLAFDLADIQAKREAAEAEAATLRQQLQQGGRLPQLLADLDTASKDLDRAANAIAEAITKARA